jgi:hypothetical protein
MASHELIEEYLADLAGRLPANAVDELADGLAETWQHHLRTGLAPTAAAHAAITEFGSITQVTDAFVTVAPGRRLSRILLATGPLVGASWGISLAVAQVRTWPVPFPAAAGYLLLLLAVVAALIAAATSHHSYRRTRLGVLAAYGLIALDLGMIAASLHLTAFVWPMAIAIPASLTRVAVVLSRATRDRDLSGLGSRAK